MVPTAHAALGAKLEVDTEQGLRHAVIVERPFHDPGKEIPRS